MQLVIGRLALPSAALLTCALHLAAPAHAELPAMSAGSPFNQDVSLLAPRADSTTITAWLEDAGGWGLGRFQIDFSIDVVDASGGDPTVDLTQNPGYFDACDPSGTIPLPAGGTVEGNTGYQCDVAGDCHLIVHDPETELLFEAWEADVSDGVFTSTCLVEWKLAASYPENLRGGGCTSADAAGFPIAPLLFDADEIAAGAIEHAIRFILPNSRMRADHYIHPASHYGGPSAPSNSDAPIYGMRFRLRADFPVESYPAAAQVVLRALQKYGMFLADGGNIALTARSDRGTTATWAGVDLGSRDLEDVSPADFDVLPGYGPDPEQGPFQQRPECEKNTITVPEPGLTSSTWAVLGALAGLAACRAGRLSRGRSATRRPER